MVHRYPADIKAFYMQPDPADPKHAMCVDVIAPDGYGELIGGSQRIHDYALLEKRLVEHKLPREAFEWYLDLRKYGSVPHSASAWRRAHGGVDRGDRTHPRVHSVPANAL